MAKLRSKRDVPCQNTQCVDFDVSVSGNCWRTGDYRRACTLYKGKRSKSQQLIILRKKQYDAWYAKNQDALLDADCIYDVGLTVWDVAYAAGLKLVRK